MSTSRNSAASYRSSLSNSNRERALLAEYDAIYFGAVGAPSVPDHISLWQLILPIRQHFDQYVNLRPIRLLSGIASPLANRGAAEIDMVCVREN